MGHWLLVLQVAVNFILLAAAINVPLQSNVNLQRATGVWLPRAGAGRGRETTEEEKEMEKAPFTLTVLSGGKVELKFHVKQSSGCAVKKFLLEHTKTPGVFHHGDTTVSIVETDYCKYIILYVVKKSFAGIYLFGRTEALGGYLRDKFKQLVLSMGYPAEQIRNIRSNERCKP